MNDKDKQVMLTALELVLTFAPPLVSSILRLAMALKDASAETVADVEALVKRVETAQSSVPEWK